MDIHSGEAVEFVYLFHVSDISSSFPLQLLWSISTSGADRNAFGGLRSGPAGLEVGGSAFGLEATKKHRAWTIGHSVVLQS